MSQPNIMHCTHIEKNHHPRQVEVMRTNITEFGLGLLQLNDMRSGSDKISFFITLFKQGVCK